MPNTIDIPAISALNNTNNVNSNSITNATSSIMDKDDFLRLFLSSLQFQDPTSPMETQDMMSQMAQLSLMEQVQNMTTAVEGLKQVTQQSAIQRGMEFVGKYIVGVSEDATTISGRVDSIRLATDGSIVLVVDGKFVGSDWVLQVSDSAEGLGNSTESNDTTDGE